MASAAAAIPAPVSTTAAVVDSSSTTRCSSSSVATAADAYTPHLKRVLKSYQAAATTSLHGPNNVRWVSEKEDEKSLSPLTTVPVQQPPPLLLPLAKDRKTGSQRSSTILEGEPIASFNVGGEERLCLPQILNTILRNFSLVDIDRVCDDLQIYCSRCSDDQLEQLKEAAILPYRVPSCGLISRTDAERLCASLLHIPVQIEAKFDDGIPVYHECFGGCEGTLYPELYVSPMSPCVRCQECDGLLSPKTFISHVHRIRAETRTCHWGFNSANWRSYLMRVDEEDERALIKLEALKTKYDKRRKSDIPESEMPDHVDLVSEENNDGEDIPLAKKHRLLADDVQKTPPLTSPLVFMPPPPPSQATPYHHHHPFVTVGPDPTIWYQWTTAAPPTATTNTTSSRSAFKPWQTELSGGQSSKVGMKMALVGSGTGCFMASSNNTKRTSPPMIAKQTHNINNNITTSKPRIANGHSNSLDSTEDALSSSSSVHSERVEYEEHFVVDGFASQIADLGGLQKVLDHHNLNCKVQTDILNEAMKLVSGYHQVIASLVKQKRFLEKELELSRLDDGQNKVFRLKQEPLEEEDDSTEQFADTETALSASEKTPRSLFVA